MVIKSVIDLSKLLGPVRNQGQRSTCMAFAMSDLNRVIADAGDALSAEFLYQTAGALTPGWSPGVGLRSTEAIAATQSPGQPHETTFPYQPNDPPDVGFPAPPQGHPLFCSQIKSGSGTLQTIVEALAKGHVVGVVLRVTLGFFTPVAGVVPYDTSVVPNAYHAVLVVGWGADSVSNVRHLLIRNSWGSSWALAGHAWLPEKFIDLHVLEVFGR